MKTYFFIISAAMIAALANQSFSDGPKDKMQEQEQARKTFGRYMESAHPTKLYLPEAKKGIDINVPLSGDETVDLFLNINTIDPEAGIEYTQLMQNESSVAVNPKNPLNLIASAVDYRDTSATWVYVSSDGGKSWKNIKLGRPYPGWKASNDPSVAFDPDGIGYMVYGGFGAFDTSTTQLVGENGVFMAKTTDQGATWKAHIPVIVHTGMQTLDSTFEDKYYITVDNSPESPYYKHLYIPWKRMFARDSATQIVLAKSTDKGETWSGTVPVSQRLSNTSEDTTYGQSWPLVACGPDGTVYCVWNFGTQQGVGFAKSTDGGKVFSEPRIIQKYKHFGTTRDISSNLSVKEWRHTVKGKVRAESYPVLMSDVSGKYKGNLYLCWSGGKIPDIFFARSTDKGETWSAPVNVHTDKTHDQFWPWMNVDPLNGDLMVSYFDSRNDTANFLVECYVSYSQDAGNTWVDRRAEDFAHDLTKNPFYGHFAGDYSGLAFYGGIGYPTWVDMRSVKAPSFTDSDVFSAVINTKIPVPPRDLDVKIIASEPDKLKLTWKPVYEKAFGQTITPQELKFSIFRNGKAIQTLAGEKTEFTDAGLTPFEKYNYAVYAVIGSDTSMPASDSNFAGGSRNPGRPEIAGWEYNSANDVILKIKLPGFREDGETPLTNLAALSLFRNNTFIRDIDVNPADAGKTADITDNTGKPGWYRYNVAVKDGSQPANTSAFSDDKLVFTGLLPHLLFAGFEPDEENPNWQENKWGYTNSFSKTGSYSLTDSPTGNYDNNKSSSFYLLPVELTENYGEITFWHAAIVDKRDTCFVEYSFDYGETWNVIAKFNELDYEPWQDGTLNSTDWKYESFGFTPKGAPMAIRFRLWSNLLTAKDGWYIDDVNVMSANSAEDEMAANLTIFPNPAQDFINIKIQGDYIHKIKSINIMDIFGRQIKAISSESLADSPGRVNLEGLASGSYRIVILFADNRRIGGKFNIID